MSIYHYYEKSGHIRPNCITDHKDKWRMRKRRAQKKWVVKFNHKNYVRKNETFDIEVPGVVADLKPPPGVYICWNTWRNFISIWYSRCKYWYYYQKYCFICRYYGMQTGWWCFCLSSWNGPYLSICSCNCSFCRSYCSRNCLYPYYMWSYCQGIDLEPDYEDVPATKADSLLLRMVSWPLWRFK